MRSTPPQGLPPHTDVKHAKPTVASCSCGDNVLPPSSAWVLVDVHTPVGCPIQVAPGLVVPELAAGVLPSTAAVVHRGHKASKAAGVLMGPPLALGPALGAAAATPEPTAPMTESGAYLPMTSGGWILRWSAAPYHLRVYTL